MDAMEAVLRNFKTIPCPSGDACTKPGCQWQHSWDREPQTSSSSLASKSAPAASQDEDGPRKRRKLSSEPAPAPAPAPVKDEPTPATPHPKSTLEKPVSPPPVKRFTPPKSSPPLKHKMPQPTASAATMIQPTVEKPSAATPSNANGASAVRPSSKPSPSHASHGATSSSPAVTPNNASTVRSSSQRAVSPRLSVASDPNTKTGKAAASTTSKTSSPNAPTPQKATSQTQIQSMNRKPEALNPRHLKTAPAPHDFRYKCLKLLHEQFARLNNELKKDAKDDEKPLILSPQELIWLALDEEERIATEKPAIYNNVIKNRIMHYKKMTVPSWMAERRATLQKQQAAITPSPARSTPKAINGPPKEVDTGLTPEMEVEFLKFLQTPIDKLAQFGYIPKAPTEEEIKAAIEGEEAAKGWEICERCKTRFQVFPGRREEDGALTSGGACTFHPGKAYYPERAPGDSTSHPKRFNCCNTVPGDTPGCSVHQTHVFKTSSPARLAALLPFKETPPNPDAPKVRAVCFDCEMGYTVKGMELLRLTATSWPDGKELLDVLVQPYGEILDLNSRYSGVWPEDIANAVPWEPGQPLPLPTTVEPKTSTSAPPSEGDADPKTRQRPRKKLPIVPSPAAARDLLFSLISPDTFLIGHALENDLNAVRIIHPCLIDTALLFPHRRGLPMRYRLKGLMEMHLNKTIQVEMPVVDGEGKVVPVEGGHDSAEDARAAGELVRLKVMERWREMRKLGWRVEGGRFVPPREETQQKEGESESSEGEVVEEGGVGVGKVLADLAAV